MEHNGYNIELFMGLSLFGLGLFWMITSSTVSEITRAIMGIGGLALILLGANMITLGLGKNGQ